MYPVIAGSHTHPPDATLPEAPVACSTKFGLGFGEGFGLEFSGVGVYG